MQQPQDQEAREISKKFLRGEYDTLGERERKVARHVANRTHVSRDIHAELSGQSTLGQRMADRVATFGGSWTFITIFTAVLLFWVILNSLILAKSSSAFDPYPYILLNLFLSMLAAVQAPIILMSQNRQAYKDRQSAEHDYEVNLKAELEIMALHEKMDLLRDQQWNKLISIQHEQLGLLGQLTDDLKKSAASQSATPTK